ncbi:MAG: glycosyltransferase [Deltaproteobacteria bacterium]|nr:glycosyltransferase [Deltaproteobacteria bacterium]
MISILTISRNVDNLKCLVDSLPAAAGDVEYELLISWNGEQSPPVELFESCDVKFHLLKPYSFSKNNNRLAQLAAYPNLLFINDDIKFDRNCIKNAWDVFCSDNVGLVGANLRYPDGTIQHAGIFINNKSYPFHFMKHQGSHNDPRISFDMDVPIVTGAFMLVDKKEFLHILFDERCEVAAQDVIFCLNYREKFQKKVVYCHNATAIHYENKTRKLFDQRLTPPNDVALMSEVIDRSFSSNMKPLKNYNNVRLRVVTEKPGWIMYRKGEEIVKRLENAKINEDYDDANVHYYINYGYFRSRPKSGLVVANFTHYDESKLADKWVSVAHEVDHCVAVSEEAASNLRRFGIKDDKITVIKVGADSSFKPKMVLGVVGRVYEGGRKGEGLVRQLTNDTEVMEGLKIFATNDSWGVPVWKFNDLSDFYLAVDYLLVPALIEGGPVPFMEALASGTLAIAPPIGVIPEFPHIEYKTGDYASLKKAVIQTRDNFLNHKNRLSQYMQHHNWSTWANQHIALFDRLLKK